MARILHTADWQIGRQYSRFEVEDAVVLAAARTSTVEKIAALAAVENVDAVLVAGDVFDAQGVSELTIRRLFNATSAFTGPWIMLPGNHDAALAESVWDRAERIGAIPANVHVIKEPGVLVLEEQGIAVLGAPLTQRQTYDDLTAWFDSAQTPAGLLRVGLAHGSVQGLLHEDVDSHNPIAADRAATAHLDYLALGDWHGFKQVDQRTVYSGTPEPDRFKDNGAGQVVLVDLPASGEPPVLSSRQVGQFTWLQWSAQLEVASDLDVLIERLQELEPNSVLSLKVSGQTDLAGQARLQRALAVAQARCRSVDCDVKDLRLEPTDEDIAALSADGYLGDVIAELRDREGDSPVAKDALVLLASLLSKDAEVQA